MSEAALTLNARQQRFAEAYASGCSATEAVRRAGYVQTDAAAGTHGYRLLKNARVIALIRRQRAELAERLRIDRDRVLRGLLVAYETARRN